MKRVEDENVCLIYLKRSSKKYYFFDQDLAYQITGCSKFGGSLPYAETKEEFLQLANIFHRDYEKYTGRYLSWY